MTDNMSQHCPNCEAQAGVIVGLREQLHMVLDREADTHCRHDAKVEAQAAEIEKFSGIAKLAILKAYDIDKFSTARIEAQAAEIERLREALTVLAPMVNWLPHPDCVTAETVIRAALEGKAEQ
jgi:hypothetical protein